MRPVTFVLGGVAALVSLAVAIVLYRAFGGGGDVQFGPLGYTVRSDSSVQVDFEVDKKPSETALCDVRARDRTGDEVGNSLVRVGPSAQRRNTVHYDLATSGRAADGEILSCSLAGSGGTGP